jgi:transposase
MWFPPGAIQIFVARDPADMRKSFEGLCGQVRDVLAQEPTSGSLFVFFNRVRDRVKILYWNRRGLCIWYHRLERGRFPPTGDQQPATPFDPPGLALILEGIDLTAVKRRKVLSFQPGPQKSP